MLNLKVPVAIVFPVVFDIGLDHVIGNISGRAHKVSNRPQMFPPVPLPQFRKLLLDISGVKGCVACFAIILWHPSTLAHQTSS